jgi:hypothetical protein
MRNSIQKHAFQSIEGSSSESEDDDHSSSIKPVLMDTNSNSGMYESSSD